MKAAQISKPGGDWELVERDIPEPGPGQVRVKVEACGICHSDVLVKEGLWPGLKFPRMPGHEVAGRIDAHRQRRHRMETRSARRRGLARRALFRVRTMPARRFRDVRQSQNHGHRFRWRIRRVHDRTGGGLAAIPDELPAEEAGPFMCAGVTVYNALRNSGARGGDVVAVHGIGGLGHLGVQYARQMGFETVALGRGKDKEPLARKLGAHHYIDSGAGDAAAELQKLGGARVILATAPNAKAISALVDGLAVNGNLLVPAAPAEPLTVSALPLIMGQAISGGLVLRHSEGFAGHFGIQRVERRASDDREISAEPRGGSLRTDAQRQSALPRRPDYGCLTCRRAPKGKKTMSANTNKKQVAIVTGASSGIGLGIIGSIAGHLTAIKQK